MAAPGLKAPVCTTTLFEWEHLVDERMQRSVQDQVFQVLERDAARTNEEAVDRKVPIDCFFEVSRELNDRRGSAAFGDEGKARAEQPLPYEVSGDVEVGACLVPREANRVFLESIDHDLDSEGSEQVVPHGTRHRGDSGAAGSSQLYQQVSHAAGRAVHEDPLARYEVKPVEQLQRGRTGERQRRGFNRAERGRAASDKLGIDNEFLRIGAPAGSPYRKMRPDVVPFAKMVDPFPDLENDAGTLVAHHVRRRDSRPGWIGAIAGVDGIDTRCFDANADVARSERVSRQSGQFKSIDPAGTLDHDCVELGAGDMGILRQRRQVSDRGSASACVRLGAVERE